MGWWWRRGRRARAAPARSAAAAASRLGRTGCECSRGRNRASHPRAAPAFSPTRSHVVHHLFPQVGWRPHRLAQLTWDCLLSAGLPLLQSSTARALSMRAAYAAGALCPLCPLLTTPRPLLTKTDPPLQPAGGDRGGQARAGVSARRVGSCVRPLQVTWQLLTPHPANRWACFPCSAIATTSL